MDIELLISIALLLTNNILIHNKLYYAKNRMLILELRSMFSITWYNKNGQKENQYLKRL